MAQIKQAWIADLSSPKEGVRALAAGQIYAVGRSLAEQAVHSWWDDKELAQLFGDDPEVTVGLAVRPETFAKIREANGRPQLAEVPADQDACEFELHFYGRVALDVLTSRGSQAQGAIAKFLSKHGEGPQQVEFRCSDVDRATQILQEHLGILAVYPETRPGANGTRVNFFLMPAADGKKVLIELYEAPYLQP
jgi:hypothetical protein